MRMRDMRLDMFTKRGGTSCVQVARTLQSYLDGDLDEPTRDQVANHLAVCRRCGLDEQTYHDILTALAERSEVIPTEPLERLRAFAADLSAANPPSGHT